MAKATVWIDLTDMLVWKGTFTGIQRVTYEYARRFEKDGAKFFAYDALDDRYVEIFLSDMHESEGQDSNAHERDIPLRRRLRHTLGAPYYQMSPDAQAFLQPYVAAVNHTIRSAIHYTGKLKPKQSTKMQHTLSSEYRHRPQAIFKAGDAVVLLGAGWNDGRTLDGLIKYKKATAIRIVQHINDILPIYQPQLFADELPKIFEPYVEKVAQNADTITVISEATKRDVEIFCKEHGIESPAIKVIRLGENPEGSVNPMRPKEVRIKDGQYILSVGTFEVRKNYQLLYQATKLAQIEDREIPTLVIAGRQGWLSGDIRHIISRDPYVRDHIIWLNDVSDAELKWLYKHCMFTIFPSIAEGWGLPVAESLNYGKLCLTSGTSAMLEIGNGMVDYFLPYDARECMEKVQFYVAEDRYKESNVRIAKEYTVFTWDDSYRQLLDAVHA